MKKFRMIAMALLLFALLTVPVSAMQEDSTQSQLEAYGTVELFDDVSDIAACPCGDVSEFATGKAQQSSKNCVANSWGFNPACGCRIFYRRKKQSGQ